MTALFRLPGLPRACACCQRRDADPDGYVTCEQCRDAYAVAVRRRRDAESRLSPLPVAS